MAEDGQQHKRKRRQTDCPAVHHQPNKSFARWNSHDKDRAPRQIIRELEPESNRAVARLSALMLDWPGIDYVANEQLL